MQFGIDTARRRELAAAPPGPRIIEGTERLAHLLDPTLFGWNRVQGAFSRLDGLSTEPLALQEAEFRR